MVSIAMSRYVVIVIDGVVPKLRLVTPAKHAK